MKSREERGQNGDLGDLVDRARMSDSRAFARLFELFYPKIYNYMNYRINSIQDAEDLSSEVFVRVIQSIRRQHGSFGAWIYRIAANLVRDYFRRRSVRQQIEAVGDEIENVGSEAFNPEKELTRSELKKGLAELTDEQQQVILLKFVEGYSTAEVAEILGKSEGSIRALQFRALSSLREVFDAKRQR